MPFKRKASLGAHRERDVLAQWLVIMAVPVLMLSFVSVIRAAAPPKPPAGPKIDCHTQPAVGYVSVIGKGGNPHVYLGDSISVFVCGLEDYVKKLPTDADARIVLFLNGKDFGIEPDAQEFATGRLVFRLQRNDTNAKLWTTLLRDPFEDVKKDPQKRRLTVTVGSAGKPLEVTSTARALELDPVHPSKLSTVLLVLYLLVLVVFLVLAWRTDILRSGAKIGNQRQPFSLGRSQMAWWFFLILGGYITIWEITGAADTITTSLLVLMGISSATALGAVAIDATSSTRVSNTRARLTSEKLALDAQITGIQEQLTQLATAITTATGSDRLRLKKDQYDYQQQLAPQQARRDNIQKQLLTLGIAPKSEGYFTDILTDDDGAVALHRFQVVVWTIVLGVTFIASVVHDLSMPDFNTNLLTLMGISSATYLGFKYPEKNPEAKTPDTAPTTPPAT